MRTGERLPTAGPVPTEGWPPAVGIREGGMGGGSA